MPAERDDFSVAEFKPLVEQGKAAYKRGAFQEAIQAWKNAQAMDPSRRHEVEGYLAKAGEKLIAILVLKGQKAEHIGDAAQAVAHYKQALKLEPRDEQVRSDLIDRIRAFENQAQVLSMTVLASILGGFTVFTALALWFIICKLD